MSSASGVRNGWTPLLVLAAAAIALRLSLSPAVPLLDPDEGRNAEIAREMAVDGDLVIPHLAGMPALDKPPGLFWMILPWNRLLGPTPLAARLPVALAALATLLVMGALARRERGTRFALIATGLVVTAPLFWALAAFVIFDMPLALCVAVVWTGLARELEGGPSRGRRLAMFAAVAAGVLLKGPVMLAWALGGSLGAALLLRSRSPLRWLGWWPGWVLVLATAGGWFALACARHPEYPRYAFVEESLGRMTSNQFRRNQPWWFVPVVLAGGALPWSLATPWRGPLSRTGRVALGFVLFSALFFTISQSKLVTYLLPALPPLAWIAAERWSDPERAARAGAGLAAVWGALALALFALGLFPSLPASALHGAPTIPPVPLLAAGALAAVVAVTVALARRPAASLAAALALTPLVLAPLAIVLAPRLGESGAPLARAIVRETGAPAAARYESCYSPGTDYLLNRTGTLVSARGDETGSNYQVRYRELLMRRGLWSALPAPPAGGREAVVVRSARWERGGSLPGCFYRDQRFVACRADRPAR